MYKPSCPEISYILVNYSTLSSKETKCIIDEVKCGVLANGIQLCEHPTTGGLRVQGPGCIELNKHIYSDTQLPPAPLRK